MIGIEIHLQEYRGKVRVDDFRDFVSVLVKRESWLILRAILNFDENMYNPVKSDSLITQFSPK